MRLRAVLLSSAVLALAPPAAASAAAIGVLPKRSCYRSGQELSFTGTGFSPGARVSIASDRAAIGSLPTNSQGAFAGVLTPALRTGEKVKTYTATDRSNPALAASLPLLVSALDVKVRPRSGRPGRKVRLRARGFTNSESLYSHVVRGRYRRTVRVGRLNGACHTKKARKRVFSRSTRTGSYIVQFDGRRKYRRKTQVKVRFRVFVFKSRRRGRAASAAGARWERLP